MQLETTTVKGKKSKDSVGSDSVGSLDTSIKKRTRSRQQSGESNSVGSHDKLVHIAVSAYYKAEARGFTPGYEVQDWLEAEAEVTQ